MKYALLLAVLFAACAPQDQDLGTVTTSTAGSGAVGVSSEALSCASESQICTNSRSTAAGKMGGGSWSWSGDCAPFAAWNGTASGGRTVHSYQTTNTASSSKRKYEPSQSSSFYVNCRCSGSQYLGCIATSN